MHLKKCCYIIGTLCQQSITSCIALLMLLCRFMEQITKYLLCSILQTSRMPFSSIWHLCDLPPLPFIYPQFVRQCRSTERFLPQTVDSSGLILPTPGLSQELHPYTVQYVDTAQILPSRVNWAKTPSNLQHCQGTCSFSSSLETSPFVQNLNDPHLLNLKTLSLLSCLLWFHSITNTKATKGSELPHITLNSELQCSQGNSHLVSHFHGILYLAFISKVGLSF